MHDSIKMHGGVETSSHILNLALDGEQSASCPGNGPQYTLDGRPGGPWVGLNVTAKRKTPSPDRNQTLATQPMTKSLY